MPRKRLTRYLLASLLVVIGGVLSQASAQVLDAEGLAAFGLFVLCGLVFVLPAAALTATIRASTERMDESGSAEPRSR